MPSHQLRFIAILVLAAIALIGMIVFAAMGITEGTAFGVVAGILGTLVPALVDAGAVESRRRDPNTAAISDDVKPPSEEITKPGVE